jgi:hypothetical protein
MKDGEVCDDDPDELRRSMGWGLLDKSLLLSTEDKKVGLLNAIISQWPEVQNKVAVWPGRGNSRLPSAETLASLEFLFGKKMKMLVHRDSDFMLPEDKELQQDPYSKRKIRVWFTDSCDIEAAWIRTDVVAAHFSIEPAVAESLICSACERLDAEGARVQFNKKRNEIPQFIDAYKNGNNSPVGHQEAFDRLKSTHKTEVYVGKDLASKIRQIASEMKLQKASSFGKFVPQGVVLGESLKLAIEDALSGA